LAVLFEPSAPAALATATLAKALASALKSVSAWSAAKRRVIVAGKERAEQTVIAEGAERENYRTQLLLMRAAQADAKGFERVLKSLG